MDVEVKRFVEFHILQSFPPSNPNRDDANNPKEALFGGVRRARISSQSFKRAIRKAPIFVETTQVEPAVRTRYIHRLLLPKLKEAGKEEEEAKAVIDKVIPEIFGKWGKDKSKKGRKKGQEKKEKHTAVSVYIGPPEVEDLVEQLLRHWEALTGEKKVAEAAATAVSKAFVEEHENVASAPDIALFGRMLADKPKLNIEAATQVAHAISTHRITMEWDFFTAVEELAAPDEQGASMADHAGYNSATFYRYLRLDWDQLVKNLANDVGLARRTVEGFIRAMMEAVPSGKRNAHAHNVVPDFIFGVVREGSFAWSLVNAFERPVRPDREEGGYMRPSIKALDRYWGRLVRVYGEDSVKAKAVLAIDEEAPLDALKEATVGDMESFIETIMGALPDEEA